MELSGKAAIVTGGGRGIGKAISLALAEMGADLVIPDIDQGLAESAAAEIQEQKGIKALAVGANVTNFDDMSGVVEKAVEALGNVQILVNNAGITRDGLIMRMQEEQWDQVLAVNLKGAFVCTKAVARQMFRQKAGKIVNISSIVGIMGNAGQANYSASKAGLIGLTKSCAKEFASRNITVNAVAPGFIATAMTDALEEEVQQRMLAQIPLARFGGAEDVARAVAFLCSSASDYITGQVLQIDGGMLM